jgi:ABC-2 type transport system ATP-binding protein
VLVSSHILAEVAQTVDSVVILDHGHLVAQSSLDELTAGTRQAVLVRTPRAAEVRAVMVADGAAAEVISPDRVKITGSAPERVAVLAAARAIPVVESVTQAAGLEDIFLGLTAVRPGQSGPPAAASRPARPVQEVPR